MKSTIVAALLLSLPAVAAPPAFLIAKPAATATGAIVPVAGDSFARTLYVFDLDTPTSSGCSGTCLEKWPPYLLSDDEAAAPLPAGFTVLKRASGLKQLALNGRLLYTFYTDRTPSDARGDGLGGVWHVILANPQSRAR